MAVVPDAPRAGVCLHFRVERGEPRTTSSRNSTANVLVPWFRFEERFDNYRAGTSPLKVAVTRFPGEFPRAGSFHPVDRAQYSAPVSGRFRGRQCFACSGAFGCRSPRGCRCCHNLAPDVATGAFYTFRAAGLHSLAAKRIHESE
jgi:hypothetical protein